MEYNNDFAYDLKFGEEAERILGDILTNAKVEVKRDKIAYTTGKVFVEMSYKGRPSGVSISKADFWCFMVAEDRFFFIKTEDLLSKCHKYVGTPREIYAGDENLSKGILLPILEFITM